MYEQREIILIPFPYSDLTGFKFRPALILSNNLLNNSEDRVCCLITSNPTKEGIEIKKEDFKEGKLPFRSWVKSYRIFTINHKIVKKKLAIMNEKFHRKVLEELNKYLGS